MLIEYAGLNPILVKSYENNDQILHIISKILTKGSELHQSPQQCAEQAMNLLEYCFALVVFSSNLIIFHE